MRYLDIEISPENAKHAWPWAARLLAAQLDGSELNKELETVLAEMLTSAETEKAFITDITNVVYVLLFVVEATELAAAQLDVKINRLALMRSVFDDLFDAIGDEAPGDP